MSENKNPIPSRLYNAAKGGHVAGTADIIDDDKGKTQDVINNETDSALADRYTKDETYSKTELNNLITTPSQKYVSVTATSQTTSATDVLPATGAADTVYRVGNWDGTQYDTTCYTEYAWNGSIYVSLNTKEYGIDDEPTAGSDNLVKSGGIKLSIAENNISRVDAYDDGEHTWRFDYPIIQGKVYYIKLISGDGENIKLGVGSSLGERMHIGIWVEYTAPESGKPFFYLTTKSVVPILLIYQKYNGTDYLKEEIEKDIKLNTSLIDRENSFYSSSTKVLYENFCKAVKSCYVYGAVEGLVYSLINITRNKSNEYLSNSYQIYFQVNNEITSSRLTAYIELKNIIDFSTHDDQILNIKIERGDWRKLSGDLELDALPEKVSFWIDYSQIPDNDGVGALGDTVFPINKSFVFTEGIKILQSVENSGHTMFNYPMRVEKGKIYYVKLLTSSSETIKICTATADVLDLVYNEWLEWGPVVMAREYPYWYVSDTTGKTAPKIAIVEKDSYDGYKITAEKEYVKEVKTTVINVSRDGTSRNGRTIHFSGLTAIADALNSITDASKYNRYIIHVEGIFHFTDPLTLTMVDPNGGEYSAIHMKPYVDIEGDGANNSIVSVDFPANTTFHDGKQYNDYQPLYFYSTGGNIRNMKIEGKNCRYVCHIDQFGDIKGEPVINIDNCDIVSHGAPDYSQSGQMECFGTGMIDGFTWNIRNSNIYNDMIDAPAFAMHVHISLNNTGGVVNFENCIIRGQLALHNYQNENNTFVNMVNCSLITPKEPTIRYKFNNNYAQAKRGDYTTILINANNTKAKYYADGLAYGGMKGAVLRIKSLTTGISSAVRFVQSSSAFNLIIGNSEINAVDKTIYGWDTQYGYVYRDGGAGLAGQAFGTIDVDETAHSTRNLATLLGDCSSVSKSLVVSINGTNYTITFNENYTSKDNDYVLGVINNAIGSVATADIFSPANLYYPNINELSYVESSDSGAIFKGMGVVFDANGKMKKAKNTDGYIDGICLDDTSLGQTGRVIKKGYLPYHGSTEWFKTIDNLSTAPSGTFGQKLGISQTEDGKFELGVTPSVLQCKASSLEIIK